MLRYTAAKLFYEAYPVDFCVFIIDLYSFCSKKKNVHDEDESKLRFGFKGTVNINNVTDKDKWKSQSLQLFAGITF
ncbi:MAG: hypothetical protein EKK37_04565 [Sphingobacteriales bacterium]|nr:MAG: hypothetical protein EKK37_04565 [Sphingobacteriales bacterium]